MIVVEFMQAHHISNVEYLHGQMHLLLITLITLSKCIVMEFMQAYHGSSVFKSMHMMHQPITVIYKYCTTNFRRIESDCGTTWIGHLMSISFASSAQTALRGSVGTSSSNAVAVLVFHSPEMSLRRNARRYGPIFCTQRS